MKGRDFNAFPPQLAQRYDQSNIPENINRKVSRLQTDDNWRRSSLDGQRRGNSRRANLEQLNQPPHVCDSLNRFPIDSILECSSGLVTHGLHRGELGNSSQREREIVEIIATQL